MANEIQKLKRKLNVRQTNNIQIAKNWELDFNPSFAGELYVSCNAKGKVNWKYALVYRIEELLKRGNVNIVK